MLEEKSAFISELRSGNWTMTDLCLAYGISRTLGYKYLNRFKEKGYQGLYESSRVPFSSPNRTPDAIEQLIISIRKKHPRYGGEKIHTLLEANLDKRDIPGISTISHILDRNNLVEPKKRIRRIYPCNPIFEPDAPNQIWSADFKGKFRMRNGIYIWPLTIGDSFSRFLFAAKGLYHPTMEASIDVFIKVFEQYGLPMQIHTDNGLPFASANALARLSTLSVWFIDLNIEPVFSDPGHPEQNGRHERMHRELKAAVSRPAAANLIWQQRLLNNFVNEYNTIRPHKALGNKTPAAVHVLSDRPYPSKIESWYYPTAFNVIRVCNNGAIRWGAGKWIMTTNSLAGRYIGLEEIGNGIWRVYYRQKLLGHLDEHTLRIEDIKGNSRGGKKSVNDVLREL